LWKCGKLRERLEDVTAFERARAQYLFIFFFLSTAKPSVVPSFFEGAKNGEAFIISSFSFSCQRPSPPLSLHFLFPVEKKTKQKKRPDKLNGSAQFVGLYAVNAVRCSAP
jgi:hypothetical protein